MICFKTLRTYYGICFKNPRKIPTAPTQDSLTPGPCSDLYDVTMLLATVVRHITAVSLTSVTLRTREAHNCMAGGNALLDKRTDICICFQNAIFCDFAQVIWARCAAPWLYRYKTAINRELLLSYLTTKHAHIKMTRKYMAVKIS